MSKSSLEAAAEAAAKVNAMLIAKGKLKLTPSHLKPKIGNSLLGRLKTSTDLITAEVDINDAPVSARNLLTRGHVQDEICKASGAAISTRGRYLTLEERKNSDCRPLYLNVQASVHEAVRIAVFRIQEILDQHIIANGGVKNPTVGLVTYTMSSNNGNSVPNFSANPLPSGAHFIQDKVFVGLEQAPPNYPVREKIFGPGGSFLQHIRTETGATVTLRGKGSGFIEPISGREAFEPLYIHITHPKSDGLQAAKSLAINLVETAHVEFVQWQQAQQPIIQPLTSVVIPQAPPIAYQSQVLVTPAVLPVSANALATGSSIVATGVQTPAVSVADGTLTASIPSLIQATPVSLPGLPVSASGVQSIPVSMQGLPSQTVLTYPTYVTNQNTIITRPTASVIDRPAVSMFSVLPTLPVSTAYSVASSQHAIVSSQSALPVNQYQSPIQPIAYSQSLAYAGVPVSQAHFVQSGIPHTTVVVTPTTITYAVSSQFVPPVSSGMRTSFPPVAPPMVIPSTIATAYPHIHYPRFEIEHRKHKYFTNQDNNSRRNSQPNQSLQESNSNHHTDSGTERPRGMLRRPDKDLMPPPALPSHNEDSRGHKDLPSRPSCEPERKRLKGALDGIASIYGSDDSSDEESGDASSSKWSKT